MDTDFLEQILPLLSILAIIVLLFKSLEAARRFDMRLMPEEEAEEYLSELSSEREWAEGKNFEFVGCYIHGHKGKYDSRTFIAAWRHRERPTFFYTMGKRCLTTLFADGVHLTTGVFMPESTPVVPPGAFEQRYSPESPEELWERHLEGENYLMDEGGAELVPSDVWFEEWGAQRHDDRIASMRSKPFWPLRIFWWMFRHRRIVGVSIQQQHEREWIRLPNEIQGKQ